MFIILYSRIRHELITLLSYSYHNYYQSLPSPKRPPRFYNSDFSDQDLKHKYANTEKVCVKERKLCWSMSYHVKTTPNNIFHNKAALNKGTHEF